jgi:hypothetical protein
MGDATLRHRLAEGARRVRDRLPTWDDAVATMERVLDPGQCQAPVPGTVPGTVSESGFSADWLALREPADRAARATRLTRRVADALRRTGAELRILDLGAGTGANMRYLTPELPDPQSWLLVDHDEALLARVRTAVDGPSRVATRRLDLNTLIADAGSDLFAGRSLVTASALLDLVSEEWLRGLATRCRKSGAALLFALSYDGRMEFSPREPEDAEVRNLVNQHQRTDKGFGRALGPEAPAVAQPLLVGLGYRVERARSDWVLESGSHELQRQLIHGWAHAAVEIAPGTSASIAAWRGRRLAHVDADRSRLIVGHEDLAAWL